MIITGHSPWMIFSHKCRLVEPRLAKYIPFTHVLDGLIVLKFDIPARESLPPWPDPSTTQPVFSLQASESYHPFAALASLAFHQGPLPNPQQVSFPGPLSPTHASANKSVTAAGVHEHVDIVSDSSAGVVLHGSAQALMSMDECFLLPVGYNANVMQTRNGGANAQVLMPANAQVDGSIVNGDMARNMVEQAANANGGDPNNQPKTESPAILNSLLDSSTADAIITFHVAPSIRRTHHYFPCTLPLNSTFDYRHFTFLSSVPPFSALILSRSSSPDSVLCFHATFSPQFFSCSVPFSFPSLRLYDSAIISPVHFEVSSLPITIYSPTINYFYPLPLHLNLESSRILAISLYTGTSTYQSFSASGLSVPLHPVSPYSSFSNSEL